MNHSTSIILFISLHLLLCTAYISLCGAHISIYCTLYSSFFLLVRSSFHRILYFPLITQHSFVVLTEIEHFHHICFCYTATFHIVYFHISSPIKRSSIGLSVLQYSFQQSKHKAAVLCAPVKFISFLQCLHITFPPHSALHMEHSIII